MDAMNPGNATEFHAMPVRDWSGLFTYVMSISWLLAVAVPILLSLVLGNPASGLPLLGVVVWFGLIRVARWVSPAGRADYLMRHSRYVEALQLCDRALHIEGEGAWIGMRRLVWLNRRTMALIWLGREDEALRASLDALAVSADPETLANCALALLRLNRYDEATDAARLALRLSRERSVLCHGVLAMAMLAKLRPAEAESTAASGLEDSRALYPFTRLERYSICLAALARALREERRHPNTDDAGATFGDPLLSSKQEKLLPSPELSKYQEQREAACLRDLRKIGSKAPLLRAMAQLEEADFQSDQPHRAERAFNLLDSAYRLAPDYTFWFLQQPGTFSGLRQEPRIVALRAEGSGLLERRNSCAPDPEIVKQELIYAEESGRAKPGLQSSYLALTAQLITLGSTFTLLLVWTWRFLILSS